LSRGILPVGPEEDAWALPMPPSATNGRRSQVG
jgi:hypothetical protein